MDMGDVRKWLLHKDVDLFIRTFYRWDTLTRYIYQPCPCQTWYLHSKTLSDMRFFFFSVDIADVIKQLLPVYTQLSTN